MDDYSTRRSGSVGHEVLLDGQVIAWTVNGWWAAVIVGLLNGVEVEGWSHQCDSESSPRPNQM